MAKQSFPRGVVLIIGAWNYPFQLVLLPLIGAIAAGNCAVVKPSEVSESATKWLMRFVAPVLDTERIVFVEGGAQETTVLLNHRWDFIFYTGNAAVARIIMSAASKFLTPVSLELGGKCPAIFDDLSTNDLHSSPSLSAPLNGTKSTQNSNSSPSSSIGSFGSNSFTKTAIKRLLMGKFLNVGQTCVAPDFCLIPKSFEKEFIQLVQQTLTQFFGCNPRQSAHLARIVNSRHFLRLKRLIESTSSGSIVIGGSMDENDLWIDPTIVKIDLSAEDIISKSLGEKGKENSFSLPPLLTEEIFGPILPFIVYEDASQIPALVNLICQQPLALYVFSQNSDFSRRIINATRSGSVSINETVSHASFRDLPFGGVGSSGIGQYYGKSSFDLFSHTRPILQRDLVPDAPLRFPPHSDHSRELISRLQPYSMPAKIAPAISTTSRKIYQFVAKL